MFPELAEIVNNHANPEALIAAVMLLGMFGAVLVGGLVYAIMIIISEWRD